MNKSILAKTAYIAITLASCSMLLSSCLGSFALTEKVKSWNRHVGNKFINELVYIAFWGIGVYPISYVADLLIINSIEFWSGHNPMMRSDEQEQSMVIDGKDAKWLVERDANGYTLTRTDDNTVVRLDFNEIDRSWSVKADGLCTKFMRFGDDGEVEMITPDGNFQQVDNDERSIMAYKQQVIEQALWASSN